jgi:hypothetical protein
VRYIVANPSSYLHFTNERTVGDSFLPFSYSVCLGFNDYKYGMQNMVSYGVGYSGMDLFGRHAARQVTYMLGTADNDPNHPELDTRCAERGLRARVPEGRICERLRLSRPQSHAQIATAASA